MKAGSEEWKPIPDYEGLYEVSNFGQVRSLNYKKKKIVHPLSQCKDKYGYLHVILYRKDIGAKYPTVHSLVASVFIGPRVDGMTVNHKDENKTNNRADNLEYLDSVSNAKYGTAQERSRLHRRKAIVATLQDGSEMTFESTRDAARYFSVLPCCITEALKGKHKTCKGMKWRYAS